VDASRPVEHGVWRQARAGDPLQAAEAEAVC